MKFTLIQTVDDLMIATELPAKTIVAAMEARGFAFAGIVTNKSLRPELQGLPRFCNVLGPMWNGDGARYEDVDSYRALSS